VPELFRQAQLITARTYEIFAMYLAAAALYWVLSSLLALGQARLERQAEQRR
jgi:cystine transport system permease protein